MMDSDSEKVRNSSPLPHLASSGEPMSNGLARQMIFGTCPDQFDDSVLTAGKGISRLMNLGQ